MLVHTCEFNIKIDILIALCIMCPLCFHWSGKEGVGWRCVGIAIRLETSKYK